VTTLFISDLHLTGEQPQTLTLFLKFLRHQAVHAETLYILGDLFETWLGDDTVATEMKAVLEGLTTLTGSGVPVQVMAGNRDFLMGAGFEAASTCHLLSEPTVIDLYGTPTLLLHGDTLCTDDIDYQQFRCQVRNPAWQREFLARPVAERLAMGRQARAESTARVREKSAEIMDVNPRAVEETLRRHGVQRLIHGHTHRPAVHEFHLDGRPATRIVLGDWHARGSVLRVDARSFELANYE
jgi:UDP-2,3-diacylglucosamine hydrolase